ncbi:lipoprotein heptaprenylglyceryl N-acetyltransferase LhaT [Virgibacillus sp. FSP13]
MIRYILQDRKFLLCLFIINLLGTIYGYIWYEEQLEITPTIFLIFVPDSPTATLFFTIVILFFLFKKHAPYLEALAIITLFKYGIWAVVMNLLTLYVDGHLAWQGYMLIASHGAMAIQGLLYAPFYKIKFKHLTVAAIWTLHNDVIDYVFEMMPMYGSLTEYMNEIGYFTFWLSIVSIFIAYWLTTRKSNQLNY